MKTKTPTQKIVSFLLLLVLLSPAVSSIGCAWMSKDGKSPSLFAPKEKKRSRHADKPKKEEGVPQTVGDFLAMPRNDVL